MAVFIKLRPLSAALLLVSLQAGAVLAGPVVVSQKAAATPQSKTAPQSPKPFVPMDPQVAIQRANAYFNAATSMIGDFVQINPDGTQSAGKLYVNRPGKLRFEYAPPATLEVVADGLSVAVHDRKTATKDVYFISQTPLKFLLKDQIDLNRDVKVIEVKSEPDSVSILVEDKAAFGGTTQIRLIFDPATFALKQWQVTDPQGYETMVSLFNVDLTKKPDPRLFQLTQERIPNTNN
ncbi:MAG: outer-membrane lipoprotein carrier protein LolA [Methylocapsa sp.]|nr:outer-membrane lipoprotein carrier protein LolA [Methylocapsa sp.]